MISTNKQISQIAQAQHRLSHDTHLPELPIPFSQKDGLAQPEKFLELPNQVRLQCGDHRTRIAVSAPERFGNDVIDDPESLQLPSREPERTGQPSGLMTE